jgi:hypothetical protein
MKGTIRRLCREAVIFMLVGLVLASIGSFLYLRHNAVLDVKARMETLEKAKAETEANHSGVPTVDQILRDPKFRTLSSDAQGSILSYLDPKYAALAPADQQSVLAHLDTLKPVPLDLSEWQVVSEDVDYHSLAETSALFGIYGFVGGFLVWLFYRLVRFAVKG